MVRTSIIEDYNGTSNFYRNGTVDSSWYQPIKPPKYVFGTPPTVKNNMSVKIKLLTGKYANGKIKSTNGNGLIDVIINGKKYLCNWVYTEWKEFKPNN